MNFSIKIKIDLVYFYPFVAIFWGQQAVQHCLSVLRLVLEIREISPALSVSAIFEQFEFFSCLDFRLLTIAMQLFCYGKMSGVVLSV